MRTTQPDAAGPSQTLEVHGLRVDSDGWVTVPGPDGVTAHMRVEHDGGRYVVTNVMLHGGRITADVLRKVQPARVEAIINLAAQRRADVLGAGGGRIHIQDLMAPEILDLAEPDDAVTLGELRSRPAGEPVEPVQRSPLRRPDGRDPEGFYREVADAYRSAAAESRKPAAVLAAEAGVPVTTAHRWVREARRRGFLPAGQRGTAG